jgi:hypothetical protein
VHEGSWNEVIPCHGVACWPGTRPLQLLTVYWYFPFDNFWSIKTRIFLIEVITLLSRTVKNTKMLKLVNWKPGKKALWRLPVRPPFSGDPPMW